MSKVLIIDDSNEVRQEVKGVLASSNHVLLEASTGEEALKIAEDDTINLFIIDYHMPGINGLEVSIRLRKSQKYSNTPIIMFTTESGDKMIETGRSLGRLWWIVKPMNEPSFVGAVKRVLELS
ncbi:MAG: response regulator [Oligoflexales bacterium]|nr:response regulator [Oligoflexales bacterium]